VDLADLLGTYDFANELIKNLKKKLKEEGFPEFIKTIYVFGYKWQNGIKLLHKTSKLYLFLCS